MKKLLALLLLILLIYCVNAQPIKYRTEYMSAKIADEEWGDWVSSNVLIVIDPDNQLVDVYSNHRQHYDFISEVDQTFTMETRSLHFEALDEEGIRCKLELKRFNEGYTHLYIRWKNVQIVYQMKKE